MPSTGELSKRKITFNISGRFQIISFIGEGAYGKVCYAIHKPTGIEVAIKKINAFASPLVCLRTLREIKLLTKFRNHENIVTMYDIQRPASYETFNDVYLIQEYMPSDLQDAIRAKNFSDDHIQYFTYQILRGLKLMHLAKVIHRDLKPSNILIDSHCNLKICDMGLSRLDVKSNSKESLSMLTEYVATRWYRAPEIMLSTSQYSTAVDMWAVGCILAEMFTGVPLFPGKDFRNQIVLILEIIGSPCHNPEDLKCIKSERAKEYIKSLERYLPLDFDSLFHKHPNRIARYGHQKINPLGIDLLEKLLVFNPANRYTVEEALLHPYVAAYHDLNDEPITDPIDASEFGFDKEKSQLSVEEMKRELYNIVLEFTSAAR